ncbi:major facilitator superfamily domain-containing protein [Ilyonectria robusta]|uniref:major facilitator superfamily domain-containing protein n=1 Tax=Ilyonectria robusta TaxID=1079257 RepID=UPI001E8E024F|nr:major facilitator superfamily domain-containing protein [Ilyonectria robusta]KAH8706205.1 major facilitator superfamily domain-containing protein [Ilyonectria robusta]
MTNYTSESTPLLGANASKAKKEYVVAVAFTLVILVDFAGVLTETPQTNILEGIICRRYYNSHPTEASLDCTAGPIQAELATITQLLNTFNLIPGLLVSIPYGVLADTYGRRAILALSMMALITQDILAKIILWRSDIFAPRLIWLTSITRFAGGGEIVASSMIFLMIADVVPAHERANTFFLFSACILVGDVVATPLGALLMSKNPWIPYILSTVLATVVGGIALLLLPETLNKADSSEGVQRPPSVTGNEQRASPRTADSKTLGSKRLQALLSRLRPLAKANIIAIMLAFFVASLGRQSTGFLVQYIRQRFNWSYAKASFVVALRGSVNLILLLFLPAVNVLLAKRGLSISARDLVISRASVWLLTIGSLVISMAPIVELVALGVVLFALGSGFSPAARSLATAFVHADQTGTLYSAMGLMQSVGGLVAGPLLATSFGWALKQGREWTGIPFLLVAGLFASGALALSFIRLQKEVEVEAEADGETRD